MKALKVFIGQTDKFNMQNLVPELNDMDDVMATIIDPTTFIFAAATDECYDYAKDLIDFTFEDYIFEIIKI